MLPFEFTAYGGVPFVGPAGHAVARMVLINAILNDFPNDEPRRLEARMRWEREITLPRLRTVDATTRAGQSLKSRTKKANTKARQEKSQRIDRLRELIDGGMNKSQAVARVAIEFERSERCDWGDAESLAKC